LLVERCYRLGPSELAARGVHLAIGQICIKGAEGIFHHVAALIGLSNNAVCPVVVVSGDGDFCPSRGVVSAGQVLNNPAMAVRILPGDDDAGLVTALVRADRGIDRHHDALQVRGLLTAGPVNVVQGP